MRVGAVLECCLYAADLGPAARFYEEVLGLERFAEVEDRHAFFRCGGSVFLLFNPARTAEGGEVPPHGSSGPGHVAFRVAAGELSAWRARLAAAGVEIEREVDWPRGGRSLYVRDPAGNSVELAPASIWALDE